MSTAALVVTTYNNPRYLGVCLASFANQTSEDFDVFIADDGSKDETRAKIAELGSRLKRPVTHVWHPDDGYRKTLINNEVFRRLGDSSESQRYRVVICVDHDTIAHRRFIEDHLAAHAGRERACFMGRRVELGPELSAAITEENVARFNRGLGLSLLWLRALRRHAELGARRAHSEPASAALARPRRRAGSPGIEFLGFARAALRGERLQRGLPRLLGRGRRPFRPPSQCGRGALRIEEPRHSISSRSSPLGAVAGAPGRYRELLLDTTYRRCANGIAKAP